MRFFDDKLGYSPVLKKPLRVIDEFVECMNVTDAELKSLRIPGVRAEDIRQLLIEIYL